MTATPSPEAPRRWFDRGAPSLADRIPLFAEAMGLVAAAWTDGFAALTATPAAFTFAGLTEARVAALPLRRGRDPVFAVLDAPGWGAALALQFDRAFVSTVVEALFGGDDGEGDAEVQAGPLTAVERRIAEVVAVQASDALKAGFADVLPSSFPFERVQVKPDLAVLGRPNAAAVVARIVLKTLGRTAEIDLVVARATLDGFADRLSVLPADEPENTDPRWSERLEGQVSRAPMALTAVVELEPMTLGALAGLKVGQTMALPRDAVRDVRLLCAGRELFRCDLGQSGGHHTVRVDEPVPGALAGL
ncbi:FliM/FliN family flagellar motor switch protein [Lichenibacterium dinghuense]|uniref:FliM/FliN family flagellar motor switch protein n=1 Tax=Lichenibacterium dinghuense TaxID=2895977 RepID=UPI001F47D0E6|nr:FliM/FliN family flagellar motor switch protein [Lichenibacterium sp. 6Y81]